MKVLTATTDEATLRSEIVGWTVEDSSLYVHHKPIGYTSTPHWYQPKTILEALAGGWKLLSAPIEYENTDGSSYFEWWLVKE